jgi:hypothetical protein
MREKRIFIGLSDRFAKPLSSEGFARVDFSGDTIVVALEAQITAVITAQPRKACITQVLLDDGGGCG